MSPRKLLAAPCYDVGGGVRRADTRSFLGAGTDVPTLVGEYKAGRILSIIGISTTLLQGGELSVLMLRAAVDGPTDEC
jgi:hypothetical protein